MPLIQYRPITATTRYLIRNRVEGLSKERPVKSLTEKQLRTGGRNNHGRLTSRRRGGGHKRIYRKIDFKREILDQAATVQRFEYDPNRSANIALVQYASGELRYILAPKGLNVGDSVINASGTAEFKPGNSMALKHMPLATMIHNVELRPRTKAQIARSAGNAAQLVALDQGMATLRMPSGEIRVVSEECRATIGEVGNETHQNQSLAKAGRNRWLGRRPRVRGMVMNPVDHPNGGGQGKSKGGGGRQQLVSPWGQLAKGFPTRKKKLPSNRFIITRHNGRKIKQS